MTRKKMCLRAAAVASLLFSICVSVALGIPGDINNDGVVNVIDARICLQIALGFIQPTSSQPSVCDVDSDGQVTLADAQQIAQTAIGGGEPPYQYFSIQVFYYMNAGEFINSLTPTFTTPEGISCYKLLFSASGPDRPNSVLFSGPPGSGLENTPSDPPVSSDDSTDYWSPCVSDPSIPPPGQYTVTYGSSLVTFEIPDQSPSTSNAILIVPTVTLNSDGTIHEVSWVYRYASSGELVVVPQSIIRFLQLQIAGTGTPCETYPQPWSVYLSGVLSPTTTDLVLPCQSVDWKQVTTLGWAYNDIHNSLFVLFWGLAH